MRALKSMKASRGLPQPLGELRYTAAPRDKRRNPAIMNVLKCGMSWRISAPGHWSGPHITESASWRSAQLLPFALQSTLLLPPSNRLRAASRAARRPPLPPTSAASMACCFAGSTVWRYCCSYCCTWVRPDPLNVLSLRQSFCCPRARLISFLLIADLANRGSGS